MHATCNCSLNYINNVSFIPAAGDEGANDEHGQEEVQEHGGKEGSVKAQTTNFHPLLYSHLWCIMHHWEYDRLLLNKMFPTDLTEELPGDPAHGGHLGPLPPGPSSPQGPRSPDAPTRASPTIGRPPHPHCTADRPSPGARPPTAGPLHSTNR